MDSEQRQHLQALRDIYSKRLRVLELQAANKGQDTPPHIQLEIEEIKRKIRSDIDDALADKESLVDKQHSQDARRVSTYQIRFSHWLRINWTIALLLTAIVIGTGVILLLVFQPHTFSSNHSSRLYFDQNGDHINLEVCADNLPGQIVFARLSRSGRSFDMLFQRASSRCVMFLDMDGDGPTLANTTYTTKAALNQLPGDGWPIPCYEATSGQGLCDSIP